MERVRTAVRAGRLATPVVVVLEGAARTGVEPGNTDGVIVVHATGSGDDKLVDVVQEAVGPVTLVSADRGLRERATALGADLASPRWLLDLLDG